MRGLAYTLLLLSFALGLGSCRASFSDVQKSALESSGDNLGVKDGDAKVAPLDEAPFLDSVKELPMQDSAAYDCHGVVIIHEKGRDRNRDNVLQPTEVMETTTECKDQNGEEPQAPEGKGPAKPKTPQNCPSQTDALGRCPDQPGQSDL